MFYISLTAFMAVVIFLMVIYVGVSRHGLKWFGIFAPAGVPGWLLPLIVVIEIISFFMRPLTHSLRLFANLTAGHIVPEGDRTFAAGAGATSLLTILGGLFLTVLFALSALEYLVAYLQAYIFTLLAAFAWRKRSNLITNLETAAGPALKAGLPAPQKRNHHDT